MQKSEIRERIFAPRTPATREVEAFGAKVVLHRLSWGQIQEARQAAVAGEKFDGTKHNIALLVLAARDEAGEAVFEARDLHALIESDGPEMDKLVLANIEVQGLAREQVESGKES